MKLLAVDSNSILNRAFYGIKLLTTKDGHYTNAIYGFLNIVLKLLEEERPDCAVFAFDLKGPTFRHELYDGYKAQRKGMPPELAEQLPVVKEVLGLMGYPILTKEGFEADDLLGTLACGAQQSDCGCSIATGDRDSLQLVSDKVTVLLATNRETLRMTPEAVWEKYGVTPKQLIDVKALMGDQSDNIPGVAGIGEKTALALIAKYSTLDYIYEHLEELEVTPSVRKKLTEGREMADMSRKLAEIDCAAPVEANPCSYSKGAGDPAALYRLLAKLELFTLIQRLGLTPPEEGEVLPEAPAQQRLQVQVCTGGLPMELDATASIDLIPRFQGDKVEALAIGQGDTLWLWRQGEQAFSEALRLNVPKRCEDSKPCYRFAFLQGIELEQVEFDLRLAGYLLSPNSTEYTVPRLAGEYGLSVAPVLPEGLDEALAELATYAAPFAATAELLTERLEQDGLTKLLQEIELPLAKVLASMELTGFAIDTAGLEQFGQELRQRVGELEQEIHTLAGKPFNIGSPKQLGEILFETLGLPARKKTKSGYSTDAEVLEELRGAHPIIGHILEYRKCTKLISTYVEGLLKAAEGGRIHTSFNQTETRTGRISSVEPNMQNIPIRTELGSRMRAFFQAGEGRVLIDADYSQIELRVLAAIAKDEQMINAFFHGEDIHTNTAAQVFDLPPLFVTPDMRSKAKAVNFSIVYGIGAFSLSKDIGVSVAEADRYIKNYFKTYAGVKDYMDRVVQEGKDLGYVTTLYGRRRYLPELKSSNKNIQAFGKRVAMNTPIQGTSADIIKIAMVRVYNRLAAEGLQARLILQVHDELIVEAPAHEAEQASQIVKTEMEHAANLAAPLLVDLGVGKTWQEAH